MNNIGNKLNTGNNPNSVDVYNASEKIKPWQEKPDFTLENVNSSSKRHAIANYLRRETKDQLDRMVERGEITEKEAKAEMSQAQAKLEKVSKNFRGNENSSDNAPYEEAFLDVVNELSWNSQKDDRLIDAISDRMKNKETSDGKKPWDIDSLVRKGELNRNEAENKKRELDNFVFSVFAKEKLKESYKGAEAAYEAKKREIDEKDEEYQREKKILMDSGQNRSTKQEDLVLSLRRDITNAVKEMPNFWARKVAADALDEPGIGTNNSMVREELNKIKKEEQKRRAERLKRKEDLRVQLEGKTVNYNQGGSYNRSDDTLDDNVNKDKNVKIPEGSLNFSDYMTFMNTGVAGRRRNKREVDDLKKRIDNAYESRGSRGFGLHGSEATGNINKTEQELREEGAFREGGNIAEAILGIGREQDVKKIKEAIDRANTKLDNEQVTESNEKQHGLKQAQLMGLDLIMHEGHLGEDLKALQEEGALFASVYALFGISQAKQILMYRHDPEEAVRRKMRAEGKNYDELVEQGRMKKVDVGDKNALLSPEEYNVAMSVLQGAESSIVRRVMKANNLDNFSDALLMMEDIRNSDYYKKLVKEKTHSQAGSRKKIRRANVNTLKDDQDNSVNVDQGNNQDKDLDIDQKNLNKRRVLRTAERRSLARDYIGAWFKREDLKYATKDADKRLNDFENGKDPYNVLAIDFTSEEAKRNAEKQHQDDVNTYRELLDQLGFDKYMKNIEAKLSGINREFNQAYIYEKMSNAYTRMKADFDRNKDRLTEEERIKEQEKLDFVREIGDGFVEYVNRVHPPRTLSEKVTGSRMLREIKTRPIMRLMKAILNSREQ